MVAVILVLVAVGAYWSCGIVRSVGGLQGIKGRTDPHSQFPDKHKIVILIAGKDYNHDPRTSYESTKGSRSDTIMLLSADLDRATLTAVGIPRDTRVTAPDGKTGKINATMARGGIKLLSQTIAGTWGVHPDNYIVLKPDAVKSIVDSLGGVQVTVIDRMFYEDAWDHLHIDLQPGTYRINGEQAAGFVRFRKSGDHKSDPHTMAPIPIRRIPSKEEGDFRRMQRQQELIHAMLAQLTQPSNIFNLSNIIDVAFNQVETDLSRPQLIALATIFKDSSHSGLDGATLPVKDAKVGGVDYLIADDQRARLMLNWVLYGDPQSGRKLTRVVVNGARSEARDTADRLKQAGFSAIAGRSVRGVTDSEVVYHAAAFEGMARDVASQLGISNVRKEVADANAYWLPEVKVTLMPASTADTFSSAPHSQG